MDNKNSEVKVWWVCHTCLTATYYGCAVPTVCRWICYNCHCRRWGSGSKSGQKEYVGETSDSPPLHVEHRLECTCGCGYEIDSNLDESDWEDMFGGYGAQEDEMDTEDEERGFEAISLTRQELENFRR